jgi:hypothetical protein
MDIPGFLALAQALANDVRTWVVAASLAGAWGLHREVIVMGGAYRDMKAQRDQAQEEARRAVDLLERGLRVAAASLAAEKGVNRLRDSLSTNTERRS